MLSPKRLAVLVCQENSRRGHLQKDGAIAERDLITRLGFRFALGISLPKIKNQTPHPLSLISPVYYKICFQEMLKQRQPSAKELRLLIG